MERLLLGGAGAAGGHTLLVLTASDNEMIVIAVASPRTGWNIADFHELPIGYISRCQAQIVANCWRNVQSGTMV